MQFESDGSVLDDLSTKGQLASYQMLFVMFFFSSSFFSTKFTMEPDIGASNGMCTKQNLTKWAIRG